MDLREKFVQRLQHSENCFKVHQIWLLLPSVPLANEQGSLNNEITYAMFSRPSNLGGYFRDERAELYIIKDRKLISSNQSFIHPCPKLVHCFSC
jgi:hypothetical protein